MRGPGLAALACALVLPAAMAGCLGTPEAECPGDLDQGANSPSAGRLRYALEPAGPVLDPGTPTTLRATFTNADCRPFLHHEPMGLCVGSFIAIGDSPVRWLGTTQGVQREALFWHSCGIVGVAAAELALAPGDAVSYEMEWDGSLDFWDHASVESGEAWESTTFYAGAGDWPLEYALPASGPGDHGAKGTVRVMENALNRDSPLRPGACRFLPAVEGARVDAVTLEASTPRAALGTPVDVFLNYTLRLPEPGCYVFAGRPTVVAVPGGGDDPATWAKEGETHLGHVCPREPVGEPYDVLVHASERVVQAHIRHTWTGAAGASVCHPEATPGLYTLSVGDWVGLGSLPLPPGGTAVVEWT